MTSTKTGTTEARSVQWPAAESAKAAARTKDTYLAAQYARLRARRGANRATTAVAHSILVAAWHMLQTGEIYTDPGGDYYVRRDPERATKRLVAHGLRLSLR